MLLNTFRSSILIAAVFLLTVGSYSQSVLVQTGDADAIASPFALSSIQFREDGKTLVGIGHDSTMTAWNIPEGKPTIPPEKWREYDKPIGTYYEVDRNYNVVVTLAEGRTWTLPHGKAFDEPIGYDEATKRLFYYNKDKGESVKIYSVLENGKDRKSIATTTKGDSTQLFVADGGRVFVLITLSNSFTITDLSRKALYSGTRLKDNRYSDGRLVVPNIHTSPDGKRVRIDSWGERIVVRMPDAAELLHVNEPWHRVAEDADNRYLAFLDASDKDEKDLTSYRVKVFFVPDEPGPVKYRWLAGYEGTRLFAVDAQRFRKQDQAAAELRYQEKKRQEAATAAAAARQSGANANTSSGANDADARAYKFMKAAENEILWAAQDMDRAAAQRSQGADKGAWCVLVRRAKEYLDAADFSLTQAAQQYSLRYTDSISAARTRLMNYRPTINQFGCH